VAGAAVPAALLVIFRRLFRTVVLVPGTNPDMHRFSRLVAASWLLGASACRPEFSLTKFTNNEALYAASLSEFERRKWDNAIAGFEKLTADLSARDSLLPRSYWYLASAHERVGEHLLAAQSFNRLVESFPEDSLADDAALEAARSYRKMWRKPSLDPTYGETAVSQYNTLVGLYPNSPLIPTAQKEIADLDNWFAIKTYDAGMYYFRRKAYISASVYFKDAINKYTNAPAARDAGIKLVEAYKADRYREDAVELCGQLRQRYPSDREVSRVCEGFNIVTAAKPDSTPPAPQQGKPPAP
jgi:outer membrane protein assembly factor BamD